MHLSKKILLFIVLTLWPQQLPAIDLCTIIKSAMQKADFQSFFWNGTTVEAGVLAPYHIPPRGSEVTILGKGYAGRVYRIAPPNAASYLLKIYDGPSGASDFNDDIRIYDVLSEILNSSNTPIRLLNKLSSNQLIETGIYYAIFEDVKGYTLEKLLESTIDSEVKMQLVARYNANQDALFETLGTKFELREIELDSIDDFLDEPTTYGIKDRTVEVYTRDQIYIGTINLSEFNVVVNAETGLMSIIDPQ